MKEAGGAQVPPAVAGKKRGRPRKCETDSEALQWTEDMVATLLELKEEFKSHFLDSKDKTSLMKGWSSVQMNFSSKYRVDATISQLKSKYQALQKCYRIHCANDEKTGNGPIPKKPSCWEDLVNHFGGRAGMSHLCLNSSMNDAVKDEEVYSHPFAYAVSLLTMLCS
jgi:hypothetical protein